MLLLLHKPLSQSEHSRLRADMSSLVLFSYLFFIMVFHKILSKYLALI